ncbi:MAG: NADH-quinone oxidoreductase subunit N, partial [Elusimicrobia bacterium]|nr:NADH-quinone oxidoreductase subunit N [Elusimicrobiota bacterium]
FERGDLKSSEGAIKYFLIGAFSSALTVYGLSLFYGYTGTTHLLKGVALTHNPHPLLLLGVLFLLVGFAFKASIVPFHFWVPDAYEGAPTPVTAYLSVAPKIATLGILLRIFTILIPHSKMDLTVLFEILTVLTMTVGNLSAFFQNNIKRLLAYSSIAQAGYMMIGFVVGSPLGQQGVFIYFLAYLFMNMGAFAVAIAVGQSEKSYDLSAFDGLGKRSLGLALLMSFFLLSLAGIPPLAGFIGKFYVFAAAIHGGFIWLAVIGVLNSVLSVYYYMRVTYRMFFVEPTTSEPVPSGLFLSTSLSISAFFVFLIGIFPGAFIESVRTSMKFLP